MESDSPARVRGYLIALLKRLGAVAIAVGALVVACDLAFFRPYRQEKEDLRNTLNALPGVRVIEFSDSQEEDSLQVEVRVELQVGDHRIEFMDLMPGSLDCREPARLWRFDGRAPRCVGPTYESFHSLDLCSRNGPLPVSLSSLRDLPRIAPIIGSTLSSWPSDEDAAAEIRRPEHTWRCIFREPVESPCDQRRSDSPAAANAMQREARRLAGSCS